MHNSKLLLIFVVRSDFLLQNICNYMKRFINIVIVFIIVALVFVSNNSKAQSTFQIKFIPLSIHPFNEPNSILFENKIDENGIFVIEPSLLLYYENYIIGDAFSWRGMFGLLVDAVSKPGYTAHIGIKQRLFQVWQNSLSIGLGGNIYGRERWGTIRDYIPDNTWTVNGDWEHKFGIMAELEYSSRFGDRSEFTLSLSYGHQPNVFALAFGYKFWISSEIRKPRKCGSCPFQNSGKSWKP